MFDFFNLILNKKIKQKYLSLKYLLYSFCGLVCLCLVLWLLGFCLCLFLVCFWYFFPIAPFPLPLLAEENVCEFRFYLNVRDWDTIALCIPVLFI